MIYYKIIAGEMGLKMVVRLAGIVRESVVDGPGFRFVVFAQGCPHRCEGCHNPSTHDPHGGFLSTPENIIKEMRKNRLLKGITLSGGEPFAQAKGFAEIAQLAKGDGYHVITYTGYTFEELMRENREDFNNLLLTTDILVDGRFLLSEKNPLLKFRGSNNQRVLDASASLIQQKPVLCDF